MQKIDPQFQSRFQQCWNNYKNWFEKHYVPRYLPDFGNYIPKSSQEGHLREDLSYENLNINLNNIELESMMERLQSSVFTATPSSENREAPTPSRSFRR